MSKQIEESSTRSNILKYLEDKPVTTNYFKQGKPFESMC